MHTILLQQLVYTNSNTNLDHGLEFVFHITSWSWRRAGHFSFVSKLSSDKTPKGRSLDSSNEHVYKMIRNTQMKECTNLHLDRRWNTIPCQANISQDMVLLQHSNQGSSTAWSNLIPTQIWRGRSNKFSSSQWLLNSSLPVPASSRFILERDQITLWCSLGPAKHHQRLYSKKNDSNHEREWESERGENGSNCGTLQ